MALSVVGTGNAATLVAALLAPASGITVVGAPTLSAVSGVAAFSGDFTGPPATPITAWQAATFTNGGDASLPFDSGIVLSSGDALSLAQANASNFLTTSLTDPVTVYNGFGYPVGLGLHTIAETNAGDGRDLDVEAIVLAYYGSTYPTLDAATLEFDFQPAGATLSFQISFGSDEYTEFEQVTDTLIVLLDGVNIGVLPNASIVSVGAINAGLNPTYFYDNNGGVLPVAADGVVGWNSVDFVTVSVPVTPGQTYHLKITIADLFDGMIDSWGVFGLLQAPGADPGCAVTLPLGTDSSGGAGCLPTLADAVLVSAPTPTDGPFTLTPVSNALVLVAALLAPDSGITTSGETLVAVSGVAGAMGSVPPVAAGTPVTIYQAATFSNGSAASIPFASGILLSSGHAPGIAQANNIPNFSTILNPDPGQILQSGLPIQLGVHTAAQEGAGDGHDADLEAVLTAFFGSASYPTHDACVLEFDFTPAGAALTLQLVFASEEYDEFVGDAFTDAVAIFLDGVNIATLPNADIITVNAINLGENAAYFYDNSGGTLPLEADGLVGVIGRLPVTLAVAVTPHVSHHLKLVIADVFDGGYDSWAFVGGLAAPALNPGCLVSLP